MFMSFPIKSIHLVLLSHGGHVVRERKWTNARHVSSAEHSQNEEPQEEVEEVEIFHLCWLLLSSSRFSPLFLSLSGQLGATHLFQTCRVISLNDENDAAVICPLARSVRDF